MPRKSADRSCSLERHAHDGPVSRVLQRHLSHGEKIVVQKQTATNRFRVSRRLIYVAFLISIIATAPLAHAGDIGDFLGFLGYVKDGYDAFDKYILNNDPSEIARVQAIVNQAKTQIIAELDGLAAAWNSSCAANAVDTFQNIDKLAPDNLQAFAISSDKCVTDAQAQIGAVTD